MYISNYGNIRHSGFDISLKIDISHDRYLLSYGYDRTSWCGRSIRGDDFFARGAESNSKLFHIKCPHRSFGADIYIFDHLVLKSLCDRVSLAALECYMGNISADYDLHGNDFIRMEVQRLDVLCISG